MFWDSNDSTFIQASIAIALMTTTVHYPFSISPSSSPDSPSLLDLARNLLVLDIGEQLVPVLSEVESQCREKVYPAEEEYEGERGRKEGYTSCTYKCLA